MSKEGELLRSPCIKTGHFLLMHILQWHKDKATKWGFEIDLDGR